GMGTLLQKSGLRPGERPELWNISYPDKIKEIHLEYFNAGSNVVTTNTFGANTLNFTEEDLDNVVKNAIENASEAAKASSSKKEKFVALDVGPLGKLLKPYGDLDFEDAVSIFAKTITLGDKYGADLIIIETMNDCYETKAALLAAKENSKLPVIVSNAYGEDGKLITGASPSAVIAMLEGMGADAIGVNCSLGPMQLEKVIDEYLAYSSVPVLFQPNAGLPKSENGVTVFDISSEEFAKEVCGAVKKGVRIVGGCCGTTPEYINCVSNGLCGVSPVEITPKDYSLVSSYTRSVSIGEAPILIGERINPTGKKLLKQALRDNDIDYILNEAVSQQDKGVHILDVNVGLPEIDENEMLKAVVCEIQAICDLPLQIDTSSAKAMEIALRRYNGKAMINSVNGKEECMHAVFPLVKKYGGLVVALTLDEEGIPSGVQGRVDIAKKILSVASEYGINKKDIVFDTLTMPVSADKNAAKVTLEALRRINTELGCNTVLGVSNVSFGLPDRDSVNSVFYAEALANGLSAAIMNPNSTDMMRTYYAFKALNCYDNNCAEYINFAQTNVREPVSKSAVVEKIKSGSSDLQQA
ncbi:MAG: homocysteine S-methyltransferase family protein, partial [Clostridia bacterium]|nr:homocysteine S-methyltransferase family protein [Clostridia bacterium]